MSFFWVVPIEVCLILLPVVFSRGLKCRLFVCSPLQPILKAAAKNLKKTGVKAHFLTDILLFTQSRYRIILSLNAHFLPLKASRPVVLNKTL